MLTLQFRKTIWNGFLKSKKMCKREGTSN